MSKKTTKGQGDAQGPPVLKTAQSVPSLVWKILTQEDIAKLESINLEQAEKHFSTIFGLADYQIDLIQACLLDFFFTQYWWARQRKFTHEQISAYFSIAYALMDNIKEKNMRLAENMEEFKNMICELNEKFFSDSQLKDIMSHISITFFQNYKMFEYALHTPQSEVIVPKEIEVECPKPIDLPYPPPLDEAMPEKIYNKFVLKLEDEPSLEELLRQEIQSPEKMQLNEEVIQEIHEKFSDLSIEDAKKIIFEVTNELITDLKADMKNKIKEREALLLNELTKTQGKPQKAK